MLALDKKWFVLVAVGIMIALVNIDMTIVNLALANMAKSLDASMQQAQWIITSYLTATALSFVIMGRFADSFGCKKIFLTGIILFTLSSVGCALSHNVTQLLCWRFIQGLGFSATLGLAFVILFANFPKRQKGLIAGIGVTICGLSQALGPTMGGVIIEYLSWPWIFWFNVPCGAISLILSQHTIPVEKISNKMHRLSFSNTFFFVSSLCVALYAINQFETLTARNLLLYFLLSLLLLIRFIQSAAKVKNPLIHLSVIKNVDFTMLILMRFVFMLLFSSALFLIPLFLQNILGYSSSIAGLIMLAITVFVILMSPLTGKMIDHMGYKVPVLLSMLLCLIASLSMLVFTMDISLILLIVAIAPLGLAVGMHVPATLTGVNHVYSDHSAASAMGLFFTIAITGGTIGVSLTGAMLNMLSRHYLLSELGNESLSNAVLLAASGARSIFSLPNSLQEIAANAFLYSFHTIFITLSCILLTAIFIFYNYLGVKHEQSKFSY